MIKPKQTILTVKCVNTKKSQNNYKKIKTYERGIRVCFYYTDVCDLTGANFYHTGVDFKKKNPQKKHY